MADLKISALPASTTPLAGTEVLPIVQSSATKQVTVANLTAGRAVSVASLTATTGSVAANTSTFSGASISGITASTKVSTDLIGTYPNGLSFTVVNGGTGWPLAVTQGVLITYYSDTYGADGVGFSYQEFVARDQNAVGNRRTFRRYPSSVGAGVAWGNWLETIVADTSTGNVTVTGGNYVPATAAKGINFTANTPAAGATSQLLNWYEEGTWTPSFSNLTVVLGAGSVAYTGRYTRIGRVVQCSWQILPTGGATTASTANLTTITNLPFSISTSGAFPYPVTDNSVSNIGPGVFYNGTLAYTPTWSARIAVIAGSGTFIV
jgi:hypothetical protein